ncbi:MAG: hypothetical protein ACHQRK_02345 [Gemmatimonadales bacterium]
MKLDDLRRYGADTNVLPAGRTARDRRGFALPMAILVIAFLTVTIAAAYAATSSELTTNGAQRSESRAYMIAQAGMENFMARRNEPGFCANCGFPPAVTYESTKVKLKNGYAYVVAQQIRAGDNTKPAIYLLRSRGIDTTGIAISARTVGKTTARAERTVAQLVYWNVNQVQVLSGWTSASGLDKSGSSGTISGIDNCGQKSTVAGIAVPTGDFNVNGNFTPQGNPPIQYLGTQAQTNATIKIDWDGMVNGNRIQPDFTFANSSAANAGWPNMSDPTYYPVIRVNGDFTMPNSGGHGTLIVMGDMTISGNNLWQGIMLVGGQMTSNGNNTMLGATMSGLNELLDPTELANAQKLTTSTLTSNPGNALAKGTKTFQYDSCQVSKAASGLASYSVYPNAWMDNFVTY